MDPIEQFKADRDRARTASDPMANLCTVGHNGDVSAELRTLVLRDIGDELAIFINATSPKWDLLSRTASILTFWPSVQIQYRLLANTTPIEPAIVEESWLLRPDPPKRMDWFYTKHSAQSSPIADRATLLDELQNLRISEPFVAPETARGLTLNLRRVERLDLGMDNGVHDRRLFVQNESGWNEQTLVP